MATIPFDTLKMAERLERAGFSVEQAKVQAAMLAEIVSAADASIVERFSSKHDVSRELTEIRSSIEKLDAKIDRTAADAKASVSEAKAEPVRWVVGVGLLQMALIAGLVLKLVPG
ncbi:DUF1640 domain-containing protein [Massilia sp. CCM 8733]|uniref:DUF1640 domain-containing protein n=1 Tax=Massilia mucilaginosa TaxID=2609282 RepID=A0ABX0NU87_9BURK|nr:DUF1640 domain-containing protein [Massilia mucilaginosa]NHZ90376.1 DUF1640 domain-containing protein [Massilia mucilaginosa]